MRILVTRIRSLHSKLPKMFLTLDEVRTQTFGLDVLYSDC